METNGPCHQRNENIDLNPALTPDPTPSPPAPPIHHETTDWFGYMLSHGIQEPRQQGPDTTTVQTHEPLMEKRRIQALVKECAAELFELTCQVSAYRDWDLNLPVAVIDARQSKAKLIVTSVGTINSVLRSSSTIGNPLMKRFFERFSSVGLEQARQEFNQGDQAEAFAELWETYLEERRSGGQPMWSVEDSTAFVMQSRSSHRDREVACVAVLCGDPHAIVTFSVPIRFLTSPAEDDGSAGSTD